MPNRIVVVGIQYFLAKLCKVSSQVVFIAAFCHLVFRSTISCEAIYPWLINGHGRKYLNVIKEG